MEHIFVDSPHKIEQKKLQKMIFIYNALENGWKVRKKHNNVYIFKRKQNHEVFFDDDADLETFVKMNVSGAAALCGSSSGGELVEMPPKPL